MEAGLPTRAVRARTGEFPDTGEPRPRRIRVQRDGPATQGRPARIRTRDTDWALQSCRHRRSAQLPEYAAIGVVHHDVHRA